MQINIEALPVSLILGFYPEERHEPQDVSVDMTLELPDQQTEKLAEDLRLTVDYSDIVKCVDQTVGGREIHLVETVVQKIGEEIIKTFPLVRSVNVAVTKNKIPFEVARGAKISVAKLFQR